MRDFSIDLIWTKVQIAITAIGGWLGYFLGGMDGLMIALIVLMTLDYISGVMCAIIDRKLSSAVGFKGICKKVFILMLVGVAHGQRTEERGDLLLYVKRRPQPARKRRACRPAHPRQAEGHSVPAA